MKDIGLEHLDLSKKAKDLSCGYERAVLYSERSIFKGRLFSAYFVKVHRRLDYQEKQQKTQRD